MTLEWARVVVWLDVTRLRRSASCSLIILNCILNIILNYHFLSGLTPRASEFTKSLWRMWVSQLFSLITFFPLVETFPGFAQLPFWKAASDSLPHFKKGFCENPGNVSTNRKRGIHSWSSKTFVNLNSFGFRHILNHYSIKCTVLKK